MFLQALAVDEVQDRLEMVNRRFTKPAVVTGFPDLWRSYFPEATIVPDDPVLAQGLYVAAGKHRAGFMAAFLKDHPNYEQELARRLHQ